MPKKTKPATATLPPQAPETWMLRLYVAGMTPRAVAALDNLKKMCEEHLAGRYEIEIIDLLVPAPPHGLGHKAVNPRHQHVLVVRPVENPDLPPFRHRLVNAPQIIVPLLGALRHLKGGNLDPLRVEPAHHVPDGAVLAPCVDALKHHQQRTLRFGI